nr:MAG: hypothetical protein OI719_00365 [Candidatus Methanoperedens sp.]
MEMRLRRKSVVYISEILSRETTNSNMVDIIQKLELDLGLVGTSKIEKYRNLLNSLNGTEDLTRLIQIVINEYNVPYKEINENLVDSGYTISEDGEIMPFHRQVEKIATDKDWLTDRLEKRGFSKINSHLENADRNFSVGHYDDIGNLCRRGLEGLLKEIVLITGEKPEGGKTDISKLKEKGFLDEASSDTIKKLYGLQSSTSHYEKVNLTHETAEYIINLTYDTIIFLLRKLEETDAKFQVKE